MGGNAREEFLERDIRQHVCRGACDGEVAPEIGAGSGACDIHDSLSMDHPMSGTILLMVF